MLVVHDDAHLQHQPAEIISRGRHVPHVEIARRAEELLAAATAGGHDLQAPTAHGMAPIEAIHDKEYLAFLESAWTRWQALPDPTPYVHPYAQPNRRMTGKPTSIMGQAGYYMATNSAPIAEGTWGAAKVSADIALTAADAVMAGASEAYALCRPPGHHAFQDLAGGFCYLNNVAIAAQHMRGKWDKLAILDIDVHHGNGTQGIFYDRGDVLFASLHGDPSDYFPFFAGYKDETGEGAGAGKTANFPMAQNSGDDVFMASLDKAFDAIQAHRPGALLVSLGFDAYEHDPIGYLKVTTVGFGKVAERIAGLGLPTLLVQEGGYNCEGLGPNLRSFFAGFSAGRAK